MAYVLRELSIYSAYFGNYPTKYKVFDRYPYLGYLIRYTSRGNQMAFLDKYLLFTNGALGGSKQHAEKNYYCWWRYCRSEIKTIR